MTSPNSTWKPGQVLKPPFQDMLDLDMSKLSVTERYKLLIGSVVPRPIAFVSTINLKGEGNLAPFSYFNAVSSDPACVMISITKKRDGDDKDSLKNIKETGEFVVNSANSWLIEPLVYCAAEFPYGVDEMQKVGLTPTPSLTIRPARVKEAAVQMECKLYKTIEIGSGTQGSAVVVFGEILLMHVAKNIYKDGKILIAEYKPTARLGGANYALLDEIFEIPIPSIKDKT